MALRIERMDFSPWGCFENLSLTFSAQAGTVDLIHGPNASGKSTASRGERSLLYGMPERTADNHTYDYADLRVGARLRLDDKSVELSRRKRRIGSLVDADDQPLPDELLAAALGGLTEDVYGALFQVDHDTLVQGGAELLQGRGEIGASLFAAAAGIASLHNTLANLDQEAERLFNSRGRTSVLHKALSDLRGAEKRLRDTTLRPARHREMTRALETAQRTFDALTQELRELDLETRAIERKRSLAPLLDAHAERSGELETLRATPDVPDSAAARRADAQGRIRAGTATLARSGEIADKLDGEIAAIEVDRAIIARDEEIAAVKENISAISKAAGDRRKREGELQEARAALKIAAAVVGVDPSAIDALRRPATARRALDRCLTEHDELASRVGAARRRTTEAKHARHEAQTDLDAAPLAADVRALEAVIIPALQAGAIADQIEQARLDATTLRREATHLMGRLEPAPVSIEELLTLRCPAREHVARASADSEAIGKAAENLASDAKRLAADQNELEEERLRLGLEGEAPTAEALARARATRDERWATIRDTTLSGATLPATDAEAFEGALGHADRLADGRTDHAAQIERTATVHARETRLSRERTGVDDRTAELRERERTVEREWTQAWAVTGLPLLPPNDAFSWLDARDRILELDRTASEAQTRADGLGARERSHVITLAAELRRLGDDIADDVSLEVAIARSQRTVVDARGSASTRAALQTTLSAAERALSAAQHEQHAATTAWEHWEQMWPARRSEAGLPSQASAEAAHEIVRAVDDGLAHAERIADLERRIAGIDGDEQDFQTRVHALCVDLAPELSTIDPERAARALDTRRAENQQRRAQRDSLIERRAGIATEIEAIERDIATAQSEIEEMLIAAGCGNADELPEIESRAARMRVLRSEIAELENQVATVGEGRFAELAEGAAGFDRDRAALELNELRERSERLRAERDLSNERIGEHTRELKAVESDTSAVQAAQDAELARAAVVEAATAHAMAKLAATVVRRAIERYRRQHQDPLLRRANQLFTRFTLGTFVELFVDVDERGEGVLVGRQRDRVLKRVPEMSTGTREQLYLALRIAAIERYVTTSGPVPVIFDDVFIESDAPRSQRIFEALGELSTVTQVIVLTHHEHLIEIGLRALKDKLTVQNLPDSAPTLREVAAA